MSQYVIGVDLGGTNLRVASYAGGSSFVETVERPTRLIEGPDRVVLDLCEAVRTVESASGVACEAAAIAIAAPGPLELPEGALRQPPNLHGWDGFGLRQAIEMELGRSILLENDANAAAFAELKMGSGLKYGVDSLCLLTLGTGVGSGFVLNGSIFSGQTGMGAEAGHVVAASDHSDPW